MLLIDDLTIVLYSRLKPINCLTQNWKPRQTVLIGMRHLVTWHFIPIQPV